MTVVYKHKLLLWYCCIYLFDIVECVWWNRSNYMWPCDSRM